MLLVSHFLIHARRIIQLPTLILFTVAFASSQQTEDQNPQRHFLERVENTGELFTPDQSSAPPADRKRRTYDVAQYSTEQAELDAFGQILNRAPFPERSVSGSLNPWRSRGPHGFGFPATPNLPNSGRVNAIVSSTGGLYVASSHGGLWGPKDGFAELKPLSDELPTLATSSVAVHPTDRDTVILATGDYNGDEPGLGIFRTVNGGESWTMLSTPLLPAARISKVMMAPWNPNVVFVSTTKGMIRSTDLGTTWSLVIDTTKNVSDFDAAVAGYVMLAGVWGDGLYRSSDSGSTWGRIPLPSDSATALNRGRMSVGISATAYSFAYVVVGRRSDQGIIGIYRTETSDIITTPSWFTVTPPGAMRNFMWGQQFYNNCLAVSKWDANTVYVGGGSILRTTDGGRNWRELDMARVHCDVHSLVSDPLTNAIIVGSDGGVYLSTNMGTSWTSEVNRQLPTMEFYNVDVDFDDPGLLYGASQDNGIIKSTGRNPYWVATTCCDGLDVSIDPRTPATVYSVTATPVARNKTTNGGGNWSRLNAGPVRTDWTTNIIPDPIRPNWVYSNNRFSALYSTNGGTRWDTMGQAWGINGIAVDIDANVVYATGSNRATLFRYTWNGASRNWTETNLSAQFPRFAPIRRISPSPSRIDRAYAIVTAVDSARIFVTTNAGGTWQDATGDLPDVQVNDIIENPYYPYTAWIGTEKGAFKTSNGGANWYRWNDGLPEAVKISDLEYTHALEGSTMNASIIAGTFGRGVFERSVEGEDVRTLFTKTFINTGILSNKNSYTDSLVIRNLSKSSLVIPSIFSPAADLTVSVNGATLAPLESLIVFLQIHSGNMKSGTFSQPLYITHYYDGAEAKEETSLVTVRGLIEDSTRFRSFVPESLLARMAVKPKAYKSSWSFDISPGIHGWNVTQAEPSELELTFANAVEIITGHEPFTLALRVDKQGLVWRLSGGTIGFGETIRIAGRNKKLKDQTIVSAMWYDGKTTVVLADSNIAPTDLENTASMPNSANIRKEVFARSLLGKGNPLTIGVPDIDSKAKSVAYVSLAGERDLLGSLQPGKSGKGHTGTGSCFDTYENLREMTGKIKKLTSDKQNNRLFAELATLKFNIAASSSGVTPSGFGELRYSDPNSPYDGLLLLDIAALADTFMTYCDQTLAPDAVSLDTVIAKINSAFAGPVDTVSFMKTLRLTGVRPVSDVDFLFQDPTVIPASIRGVSAQWTYPETFELRQNYPNPFNPTTSISFVLATPSLVTLKVYNVLGEEVATLVESMEMEEGIEELEFDPAGELASGVYFYRLSVSSIDEENPVAFTDTKRMVLVK